jgi:hypothetical protein
MTVLPSPLRLRHWEFDACDYDDQWHILDGPFFGTVEEASKRLAELAEEFEARTGIMLAVMRYSA